MIWRFQSHELAFAASSTAVAVSAWAPRAVGIGETVTERSASHPSVAVGGANSIGSPGCRRTQVVGALLQSIVGGVVSSIVTSRLHESGAPPSTIAPKVTRVVPSGNPAAGASLVGFETAPPSHDAIKVGAGTSI